MHSEAGRDLDVMKLGQYWKVRYADAQRRETTPCRIVRHEEYELEHGRLCSMIVLLIEAIALEYLVLILDLAE